MNPELRFECICNKPISESSSSALITTNNQINTESSIQKHLHRPLFHSFPVPLQACIQTPTHTGLLPINATLIECTEVCVCVVCMTNHNNVPWRDAYLVVASCVKGIQGPVVDHLHGLLVEAGDWNLLLQQAGGRSPLCNPYGNHKITTQVQIKVKVFYLSNVQCNRGSYWAVKFLGQGNGQLRNKACGDGQCEAFTMTCRMP